MKKFRGNDRRILAKMNKVMGLIAKRDTRALNPAKTTALSTRDQMIPVANTTLVAHVAAVQAQVTALLAATI